MITNDNVLSMLHSPVRRIRATIEVYEKGNIKPIKVFPHTDKLKSFSIERVSEEGKFFGIGVCHKANIHLLDPNRELNITTGHYIKIVFEDAVNPFPLFYVSEVHRDENTNELSITAYDALYRASAHTYEELTELSETFTLNDIAVSIAGYLGLTVSFVGAGDAFSLAFEGQANLDGTEDLRFVLDAMAEATQTVYYIDNQERLTFKRLDKDGSAVYTISKDKYFTLESGANRRLASICSATELGDNLTASLDITGTTQYIRDNPFWDMREDRASLVDNALTAVGGMSINQFVCSWRGNYLLEVGDKIALETKDNKTVISFVLDDVISYDGTLSQQTQWHYTDDEAETASNPTGLGDVINKTFARVDKANKEIAIVASETASNADNITSLLLNTESLTATVQKMETQTSDNITALYNDIAQINSKVSASITAEDISLEVSKQIENGVNKIETTTGYVFNDEGLTVSKTGSEMATQITEDGMIVSKNEEAVLTANNIGVNAVNLHATTYLIIGKNSRFEDYGDNRTGCFWIGG